MKFYKLLLMGLLFAMSALLSAQTTNWRGESVYKLRPDDPEAFYFTPENYNIRADGKMDVSEALQKAIYQVKTERNFGILFIPEGRYLISRPIYVPPSIRLIGYGKTRPEIILAEKSRGYQSPDTASPFKERYMICFTGGIVKEGEQPRDANPGTFYSALSNIDFRILKGNPYAIALRAHFAQHGFISHCVINAGNGLAGMSEIGNEMENVTIIGGEYGIMTGPTSPSWPMMTVDTYFEGQRKAAILSHYTGFTIVNMHVKNTPVGIEIMENNTDRLMMENCLFENISRAGIIISRENSTLTQVNLRQIECSNVPVFALLRESGKTVKAVSKTYRVNEFVHGLVMDNLNDDSKLDTRVDMTPILKIPAALAKDIPLLPSMDSWVNIRQLGAKGDGETDDTKIFRDAIAKYQVIYVPQGWYRLTGTLKMRPGTKLIGFHPMATQFILKESEPAFSGFGGPVPLVESSQGGDDILNGIGIFTGGINYRAVGCKWMAGEKSFLNDVKFVGGHGTMRKPLNAEDQAAADRQMQSLMLSFGRGMRPVSTPDKPVNEQGLDLAWDNQYWSLWITNGGGGTIKDIWTASTYATSGLYASNSSTPSRLYAISLEHHVRNEARFENIANWKIYAFQLEEESREGKECQMVELSNCRNIRFNNLWIYRVIRVATPKSFGVRLWNCRDIEFRNVHNYTQKLWVTEFTVYDVNKRIPVYPWEYALLKVNGSEKGPGPSCIDQACLLKQEATGFDFTQGITADSKGNVYFCESRKRRIYKWDAETSNVSMLADYPIQPFVLATDTKDNLLVVCRYDPQPGYMVGGKQETVKKLPDDNPAYSSWGNGGWAAYVFSINPDNPDETFVPLARVATSGLKNISKIYYPASRYHDTFTQAVQYFPDSAFMATDGVTVIPETYDIGRCANLALATPGKTFYVSDEMQKRLVKLEVGPNGQLSNLRNIQERGEYSYAIDSEGNLYVADGQIFVFDKTGKEINKISLPERPVSIAFGGKDHHLLFITTETSLYSYKIR